MEGFTCSAPCIRTRDLCCGRPKRFQKARALIAIGVVVAHRSYHTIVRTGL
jgi:hypothetical protein